MTILEMMNKRNKAWTAAKNFAQSHKNDKGVLTDEDYATYQNMEKDIENMSREISRMQREAAMEEELNKPVNTPIMTKPMNGMNVEDEKVDFFD